MLINSGNVVFRVRLTDDVISGCVGLDYVIEIISKKFGNWWANFQKKDETRNTCRTLLLILGMHVVPILNIIARDHSYQNLWGFKVANRRKIDIFLKSFRS